MRLGSRPADALLAPCVAVPVSPPMSARSSSSSRSRRIGQHRRSRPAGMSRRPTGSPVVRYGARANARSLDVMRWGLVSFWAKDIKVGFANINAKAEGSRAKPAFRGGGEGDCGPTGGQFADCRCVKITPGLAVSVADQAPTWGAASGSPPLAGVAPPLALCCCTTRRVGWSVSDEHPGAAAVLH